MNPKPDRSVRKIIDALLKLADGAEHGEYPESCFGCKLDILLAELDGIFK